MTSFYVHLAQYAICNSCWHQCHKANVKMTEKQIPQLQNQLPALVRRARPPAPKLEAKSFDQFEKSEHNEKRMDANRILFNSY